MLKTTTLIASSLIALVSLAPSAFAEPENSLLKAAASTPVSDQQESAPIIEASIDEPATLIPNASASESTNESTSASTRSPNSDDLGDDKEMYKDDHPSEPATIAFVHLTNIAFAGEQIELSAEQTQIIDKAIAHIQRNAGTQKSVLVTAHADDGGDDAQNLQLSHARASNVANYLKKQGVIDNVIRTHSFGRSQPRDENWTESGRQVNRRVSITLIKSTSDSHRADSLPSI